MSGKYLDRRTIVLTLIGLLIVLYQLYLLLTGATWSSHLVGLAVGLAMEIAFSFLLGWAFPGRRIRKKSQAGVFACPKCSSLQTDKVVEEFPDGRRLERWQCFQCDHSWQ